MKLKYRFVTRNVGGNFVAVAVGDDGALFNGMVKLNKTGAFVLEQLKDETTVEEIADKVAEKYDVTKEQALKDVAQCIESFRASGILKS